MTLDIGNRIHLDAIEVNLHGQVFDQFLNSLDQILVQSTLRIVSTTYVKIDVLATAWLFLRIKKKFLPYFDQLIIIASVYLCILCRHFDERHLEP